MWLGHWRDEALFMYGQAGRAWVVQTGEETALGRPQSPFQCLKGLQELKSDFGEEPGVTGQERMASHCQREGLDGI